MVRALLVVLAAGLLVRSTAASEVVAPYPPPNEYPYVEELPEVIHKAAPVYPEAARNAGIQGTVIVQARVLKDGRVSGTRVLKSIPQLDAAAVRAVRRWRFQPALSDGKPVAVWVAVPVKFSLH